MKKDKISEHEYRTAIKNSKSIRQVLLCLKLNPQGGNYRIIHRAIKLHSIDTSHFTGNGWNKGLKFIPKRPIEDYLSNKLRISSYKLKNRLLRENLLQDICYNCKGTTWLDFKIPLELDHIDGNSLNNNLDNLRLLCPNCHALTPTYRGKNVKKRLT